MFFSIIKKLFFMKNCEKLTRNTDEKITNQQLKNTFILVFCRC